MKFGVTVKVVVGFRDIKAVTSTGAEELALKFIQEKLKNEAISVERLSALAWKVEDVFKEDN